MKNNQFAILYVGAVLAYALIIASGRAKASAVPVKYTELDEGNTTVISTSTATPNVCDINSMWFECMLEDWQLPSGYGNEQALVSRQYDSSDANMTLVAVSRYVPVLCNQDTSEYDMWLLDGALLSRRALSAVINNHKYGTNARTIVALIYLATGGYSDATTFSRTTDQVDEIQRWSLACNVTTLAMSSAMNVTEQELQKAYDEYNAEPATLSKRGFFRFANDVRNKIQKQFLSDLYAEVFKRATKPVAKSPRSIGYKGAFISWHSVPKSDITHGDLAKVVDYVASRSEFWQRVWNWGWWGYVDWISVKGVWSGAPTALENIVMCLSNRSSSC